MDIRCVDLSADFTCYPQALVTELVHSCATSTSRGEYNHVTNKTLAPAL